MKGGDGTAAKAIVIPPEERERLLLIELNELNANIHQWTADEAAAMAVTVKVNNNTRFFSLYSMTAYSLNLMLLLNDYYVGHRSFFASWYD